MDQSSVKWNSKSEPTIYKMMNNQRSTTQSVAGDVHPAGQTLQTWQKSLYMWKEINMKRSFTSGVGDRGAESTGETDVALVASLYKATEPSRCCFKLPDSRSPNSKSNPVGRIQKQTMRNLSRINITITYRKSIQFGRSKSCTIFMKKNYFSVIRSTKMSKSQSNSSLNIPF